jgi:hypothetical protein
MCNLYSSAKSVDEIRRWFDRLQMTLRFPEGLKIPFVIRM